SRHCFSTTHRATVWFCRRGPERKLFPLLAHAGGAEGAARILRARRNVAQILAFFFLPPSPPTPPPSPALFWLKIHRLFPPLGPSQHSCVLPGRPSGRLVLSELPVPQLCLAVALLQVLDAQPRPQRPAALCPERRRPPWRLGVPEPAVQLSQLRLPLSVHALRDVEGRPHRRLRRRRCRRRGVRRRIRGRRRRRSRGRRRMRLRRLRRRSAAGRLDLPARRGWRLRGRGLWRGRRRVRGRFWCRGRGIRRWGVPRRALRRWDLRRWGFRRWGLRRWCPRWRGCFHVPGRRLVL
ncbi:MAG: hypothetical protein BJ554DRAFT_2341, partial [Olpidium bornovanus]